MRCLLPLSLLLAPLLSACGGGGGGAQAPAPPPSSAPAPISAADELRDSLAGLALADFFDVSYGALLQRSPESVVGLALTERIALDSTELDDWSDDYQRETLELVNVVRTLLDSYDTAALTSTERLDLAAYRWYLDDRLERERFLYHEFVATYLIFSVPSSTERFFSDLHPLTSSTDADDFIARLTRVDRKLAQLADHVRQQQRAGIVEPALTLDVAIGRVRPLSIGPVDNHPYFLAARQRINNIATLSVAERNDFVAAAREAINSSVIPGYAALLAALETVRGSAPSEIGVGQYRDGREYYASRLRHHTGTNLSAEAIHNLGLAELDRIHAEMRSRFDQLGYPADEPLSVSYGRVAQEGGTVPAPAVLATYTAIVADAESRLATVFDIAPVTPVAVLPDEFGGFYIGPSIDGARPGAFYAGTSNDEPRYLMKSLSYHEAVPGHHLQIALATERDDAPLFRRLGRNTGFVEGWALYAERLALELGWYDGDIYGELGQLQYEALRAARLVIDTGIHFYGWDFTQAVVFNIDNTGFSASSSQGAAARYSVWPGQATGYMVGLVEILRHRQRAQATLGANFDLIAFHRLLLETGAVPLELLDGIVDDWIASQ